MQDSRINYVVVGAFVTAMVVALVVIISVLAGRSGASDPYYTIYDNVTGIKYGTVVFYEGYQIGQVDSIEPVDSDTKTGKKALLFRVNLKVRKGWHIPEDSVARATVSGLLSAMTIDIRGGQSEKLIASGGQIRGISASNFFATLSEIGAQFGDLSNESLKPMLGSLNHLILTLDRNVQENLPAILKDVQVLTGALAKDAPEIAGSLKRASQILEKDLLKPENIRHIDASLANIEQTTENVARVSAELEQTRKVVHDATVAFDKLVKDNAGNIDESMRDLRYTLDTVSRNVDDIAENFAATARNMAEFSHQIRDNPGLILRGASPPDESKQGRK